MKKTNEKISKMVIEGGIYFIEDFIKLEKRLKKKGKTFILLINKGVIFTTKKKMR